MKAMMTAVMTAAIKPRLFIFPALPPGLGSAAAAALGAPPRSRAWEEGAGGPAEPLARSSSSFQGARGLQPGSWAPGWGSGRRPPIPRGSPSPGVCVAQAWGHFGPPIPATILGRRVGGTPVVVEGGGALRVCKGALVSAPRVPPPEAGYWVGAPPPGRV